MNRIIGITTRQPQAQVEIPAPRAQMPEPGPESFAISADHPDLAILDLYPVQRPAYQRPPLRPFAQQALGKATGNGIVQGKRPGLGEGLEAQALGQRQLLRGRHVTGIGPARGGIERCRSRNLPEWRRGRPGTRQGREYRVLQVQRVVGIMGRGLVSENRQQVHQQVSQGGVARLPIATVQPFDIALYTGRQLHQPAAQRQRPIEQRQHAGEQQPTGLLEVAPTLLGIGHRLAVRQGHQCLGRGLENLLRRVAGGHLLAQLRRSRLCKHGEFIARQKAADVRFVKAIVGVDGLARRGEPGQDVFLQVAWSLDRREQMLDRFIFLQHRAEQWPVQQVRPALPLLRTDDEHTGDHIRVSIRRGLECQRPQGDGLPADLALGRACLHGSAHPLKTAVGQTVFTLDLRLQGREGQLYPQLPDEELATACGLSGVIDQHFFQQGRVGLADIGLLHTALDQAIRQPRRCRVSIERDVLGGVRETGKVFQGQLGQGHRDRVHLPGNEPARHRHWRGDYAIEAQANLCRLDRRGVRLRLQAVLQLMVGIVFNRLDALEKMRGTTVMQGYHPLLQQMRAGDAVLVVRLAQPQRHGLAQTLLQRTHFTDKPAPRINDVIEQRLTLICRARHSALDAVDFQQLARQVARRQGIERVALGVQGKPLFDRPRQHRAGVGRQQRADRRHAIKGVNPTRRAEQQGFRAMAEHQQRQHLRLIRHLPHALQV